MMPALSRLFLFLAMLSLLIAVLAGGILLWEKSEGGMSSLVWRVHYQLMLKGWVTLMILSVGYWIFPRPGNQRPRSFLLPLGLVLWLLGIVFQIYGKSTLTILQPTAVVLWISHFVPRILYYPEEAKRLY